jgi:hypothetical protein
VTVQRIPPAAHPAGGLFFTRFNNPIFAAHGGTSIKGMIEMRIRYLAMSVATLTAMAATELSARADDMTPAAPAAPAATAAAPTATPDAPPVNVPRPSIVPKTTDKITDKTAEPVAPQASDDTTPHPRRLYTHRRHWRYAYWEPFPVYWPHIYHSRIYWNRIPWFSF